MKAVAVAGLLLLYGCAARRAPFVAVPEAQFRAADDYTPLPLSSADSERLRLFLEHGGDRYAAVTVPDAETLARERAIQALADSANLAAASNTVAKGFCDLAVSLCRAAPLFHKRLLVRQIVDARNDRPPVVRAPLAVSDGKYWWIFRHTTTQLTGLLLVKAP